MQWEGDAGAVMVVLPSGIGRLLLILVYGCGEVVDAGRGRVGAVRPAR
jgi:hypothetical protein